MKKLLSYLNTDQHSCYDENGNEIPCPGSGQDGERRLPLPYAADKRFREEEDIVTDTLTGLVWTKNANIAEFPLTWKVSLDFIISLNHKNTYGFNDWRLPNRREMRSLISHNTKNPTLPSAHPFQNVFLGWYWTSTTAAINPQYAWYLHMEGARMFYGRKDQYYLLWPVRGNAGANLPKTGQSKCYNTAGNEISCCKTGQDGEFQYGLAWPAPRFIVKEDIVVDTLTDLSWLRNAYEPADLVTWEQALSTVAKLNDCELRKYGKWRLPNINELESLADYARHSPALPDKHPFTNVQEAYWSSTTSFFETDWAWVLYLHKGAIGVGYKKRKTFAVWPICDPAE